MSNKKSIENDDAHQEKRALSRIQLEPLARLLVATNLLCMGTKLDGHYGSDGPAPVLAVRASDSRQACLPMFWVSDGASPLKARSVASFLGDPDDELPTEYTRIVMQAYEATEKLGLHGVEEALDAAGGQAVREGPWGPELNALTQDMCRQWMSVDLLDLESLCQLALEAQSIGWKLHEEELAWLEAANISQSSPRGKKTSGSMSIRV